MAGEILIAQNLKKTFLLKSGLFEEKRQIYAVNGVSFSINEGETLGLVGESGCGKSTVGKMLLNLIPADSGSILFKGKELSLLTHNEMISIRKEMQIIFQDPFASLNPRMRVGKAVGEILEINKISGAEEKVKEMLDLVGVGREAYNKYPHEFSGGQRQRVCIARALIMRPKLVIADEPVSSLDVSVQAQIINLLKRLKEEFKLTYLFISHDLRIIRNISDRVCVMYLGKVMEYGGTASVYERPLHPYTEALISAVPTFEKGRKRIILEGDIPTMGSLPKGCFFYGRCPKRFERCSTEEPLLIERAEGQSAACHLWDREII